ncbi:ATP synthase A1 subunit C [Candidatus Woesearchaeota archaeon]|nr:ATP synthase A1 subunit C [Candidatus Woesearchaeota archaeon]
MLQKLSSRTNDFAAVATARYPYTYARVAVMRSKLLKKGDYAKIARMSLNEIINFLESSEYKREIDELAVLYSGIDLTEIALNRNLTNTAKKLRHISPPGLRSLIGAYLKRKDIESIKTIIRGKYTNSDEKEVMSLLQPYELSYESLKSLLKKQSIEEILKETGILKGNEWKPAYEKFRETNMLIEIENALDHHYLKELAEAAAALPSRGSLFKAFIIKEMEVTSILNILRLKREGMEKKDIRRHATQFSRQSELLKRLIEASMDDFASVLQKTMYEPHIRKGIEEYKAKGSLTYIETELYTYLLKKALHMLRQRPLAADSIIGYVFAKEIEAKNLKMIVKAKQLGLLQQFIEEQIIA